MNLNWLKYKKFLFVVLGALSLIVLSGCTGLFPQFTYQGQLTDQNGNPISDTVSITYKLYNADTGGDLIYTDTNTAVVPNEDGLFNTVVGPDAIVAGLSPEDLAQPLWVEVKVGNGVYTETLTPRQRLYGSPYAFTLMPGAVISGTMDTTIFGASGINAITSVYNMDVSDPIPALRVVGDQGIELVNASNAGDPAALGVLNSEIGNPGSSIAAYVANDFLIYLDNDGPDEYGAFVVYGDTATDWCRFNDSGDHHCTGTKSSVTEVSGEQRALYAIESPDVWFEDFGSSALTGGKATVNIDSLFAQTINLDVDYHVFLTPLGDCNGLYVTNKTAAGFEVRELGGGKSNVSFDYRIIAKRSGYENNRLDIIDMQATEDK